MECKPCLHLKVNALICNMRRIFDQPEYLLFGQGFGKVSQGCEPRLCGFDGLFCIRCDNRFLIAHLAEGEDVANLVPHCAWTGFQRTLECKLKLFTTGRVRYLLDL